MVFGTSRGWWLLFRIAALISAIFQTQSFISSLNGDFSKPNWGTFFVLISFMAFGIFFVVSMQAANTWSPSEWRRPSWFTSPFSPSQPLLLFDFGSYYFLVVGAVSLIDGINANPKNWAWELPLSMGIGIWIGVRLCLHVFRDRFVDD